MGVVESTRDRHGKVSTERRDYLRRLPVEVPLFARAVRGHRAVENHLHWTLDVVFGEDRSRARTGFAVANLGVARRRALHLLRQDKTPGRSSKRQPRRAAFDPSDLENLLKF